MSQKEVNFKAWCPHCSYYKLEEVKSPCNECLNQPWNLNSTRPVNFDGDIIEVVRPKGDIDALVKPKKAPNQSVSYTSRSRGGNGAH